VRRDHFDDRRDGLRKYFASALEGYIDDACAVSSLSNNGASPADSVENAYCRILGAAPRAIGDRGRHE
jgi:hypothetical protein